MSGGLFTKKVYESEVEGKRDRGRPCTRLLDAVKKAWNGRSLELRDVKLKCIEREHRRNFVSYTNGNTNV